MSTNRSRKKKRKLSRGTKDNLTTIIDNLSIIIGRKTSGKIEPKEAYAEAFANTDTHIAAISLAVPEIDSLWQESNARDSFLKIKKRRQFITRALLGGTIVGTVLIVAAALVAFVLMDHWSKWIILVVIAGFVMLGSLALPQRVYGPYLLQRDFQIPEKYPEECSNIDIFIKDLLKMRK